MAESPTEPESRDDAGVRPGQASAGMPGWVKVFLIIAIVLVLAFIVSRLFGVQHGPGLHNPGGSGAQAASLPPGTEEP
jgi:hypothetical protein